MPRCECKTAFSDMRGLTRHQKTCEVMLARARTSYQLALHRTDPGPVRQNNKRIRLFGVGTGREGTSQKGPTFPESNLPEAIESTVESIEQDNPTRVTRAGRRVRRTWRVEDVLPEKTGTRLAETPEPPQPADDHGVSPSTSSRTRRVVLLVTEQIRTIANAFGVRRFYKRRPKEFVTEEFDLSDHYQPSPSLRQEERSPRRIKEIIAPFPNLTTWLLARYHWLGGGKKTETGLDDLQELLLRDDFNREDLRDVSLKALNDALASGEGSLPWEVEREGWTESSIVIGIPTGQKPTQSSRRAAASERQRIHRHEFTADVPGERAVPGHPFAVPGFWHRSICAEIRRTLSSDPAAKSFVYEPFFLEHSPPDSTKPPDRLHWELYNSPAWVDEDVRLQNSPGEPGCTLPRAIASLMFWSDATQLTQFGQAKVWPIYMYFGNQSKYDRARPTSNAAHHIAYLPSLPDHIQDFIRSHNDGKAATPALNTHCRRELFHGGWTILLDNEFQHAYKHGMVIDCVDGIRRRIYPRIFVYSADYPEKVLIATIRDQGLCPCPRCLVTFDKIPDMGSPADLKLRNEERRVDSIARQELVAGARQLIYKEGYVVNSAKVEEKLKSQSLIPTTNAFSARLGSMGFDFHKILAVDMLHEFEIGIWKAVFVHLLRILDAHDPQLVHSLNHRFRQVPTFGGIRRFDENVSDMRRITARDYEDILQCIIPCFEGLLPTPYNEHIMSLLFTLAYWHGLAKMRMHSDTSLRILSDATSALGAYLRHFVTIVCPKFSTKETVREYAARLRAEASRASSTGSTASAAPAMNPAQVLSQGTRRPRTLNLNVVKLHFLGDYPAFIAEMGSTDGYTTQTGELEHRRIKARYARTNRRKTDAQLVKLDVREARLRIMGYELSKHGINVPGASSNEHQDVLPTELCPKEHHRIAAEQKNAVNLCNFQAAHVDDPAVHDFVPLLKAHTHARLKHLAGSTTPNDVIIQHDRIYPHATAIINFTTYDLQRDQDVIHPSHGRSGILVSGCSPDSETSFPWVYAWVLGIYHMQVYLRGVAGLHRVEFLWVRWMDCDHQVMFGPSERRLERVKFIKSSLPGDALGFVDPSHIIRGCHFIPAFQSGRTTQYLPNSTFRDPLGDWEAYYVNRFADRDIMVRYLGVGVGHGKLKSSIVEMVTTPDEVLQAGNPVGDDLGPPVSENTEGDEHGEADDEISPNSFGIDLEAIEEHLHEIYADDGL